MGSCEGRCSEQRLKGKLCIQRELQYKPGHSFPVLPINFLWWTVQRQLQPNNTPLAWTRDTLEFSPTSLTSLGWVPLHRAQYVSPYMVMLGSTTWNRLRKAAKAKGYSCISPGFNSSVLSTVDSIERQWPKIERNPIGPAPAFLGKYKTSV